MKGVKGLVFAGFGALVGVAVVVTAGPLNPPGGPVTSSYKTLTEIEPRIPVQSLPGDLTALYVISQPGSYYLAGNVAGVSGKNGIRVPASDVTIDLRGFVMDGAGVGGDAISAEGSLTSLAVRDGTIRSWTGTGVNAASVAGGVCQGLLVRSCSSGLNLGQGNAAELCIAADLTGAAVAAAQDGHAGRCVAMRTGGINLGLTGLAKRCIVGASGAIQSGPATECTVRSALGITCYAADSCTSTSNSQPGFTSLGLAQGCTSFQNNNDGIISYPMSRVSGCSVAANTGFGVRAAGFCVVRDCTSVGNTSGGVFAINSQNIVESNLLSGNQSYAVNANDGFFSAILSNFSGSNVGNYLYPSTLPGYIGQISTPSASFVTTDPWMNIAY